VSASPVFVASEVLVEEPDVITAVIVAVTANDAGTAHAAGVAVVEEVNVTACSCICDCTSDVKGTHLRWAWKTY
jgi:hypothetical protein